MEDSSEWAPDPGGTPPAFDPGSFALSQFQAYQSVLQSTTNAIQATYQLAQRQQDDSIRERLESAGSWLASLSTQPIPLAAWVHLNPVLSMYRRLLGQLAEEHQRSGSINLQTLDTSLQQLQSKVETALGSQSWAAQLQHRGQAEEDNRAASSVFKGCKDFIITGGNFNIINEGDRCKSDCTHQYCIPLPTNNPIVLF